MCILSSTSSNNDYELKWNTRSQIVSTPESRDARHDRLDEMAFAHLRTLGPKFYCVNCKARVIFTCNACWVNMIRTYVSRVHGMPIVWAVLTVCCAKDVCGQEACRRNEIKWNAERPMLLADGLHENVVRKCSQCRRKQERTEKKFRVCGRCRVPHYCSTECQKAAWVAKHRAVCFDAAVVTEVKE